MLASDWFSSSTSYSANILFCISQIFFPLMLHNRVVSIFMLELTEIKITYNSTIC
jgi:hypothetical protein